MVEPKHHISARKESFKEREKKNTGRKLGWIWVDSKKVELGRILDSILKKIIYLITRAIKEEF
jgi:hypothetical protein